MSLLIRSNVHLPRSCRKCPFNGGDWCIASEKVRIGKHGNVNEHRHPNCPLVEIFTPHGRLIDANALISHLQGLRELLPSNNIDCFDGVISWVKNSPTIIEAEVSE